MKYMSDIKGYEMRKEGIGMYDELMLYMVLFDWEMEYTSTVQITRFEGNFYLSGRLYLCPREDIYVN
jgi:hypothetical protein